VGTQESRGRAEGAGRPGPSYRVGLCEADCPGRAPGTGHRPRDDTSTAPPLRWVRNSAAARPWLMRAVAPLASSCTRATATAMVSPRSSPRLGVGAARRRGDEPLLLPAPRRRLGASSGGVGPGRTGSKGNPHASRCCSACSRKPLQASATSSSRAGRTMARGRILSRGSAVEVEIELAPHARREPGPLRCARGIVPEVAHEHPIRSFRSACRSRLVPSLSACG
jgi:hypothetical protein